MEVLLQLLPKVQLVYYNDREVRVHPVYKRTCLEKTHGSFHLGHVSYLRV